MTNVLSAGHMHAAGVCSDEWAWPDNWWTTSKCLHTMSTPRSRPLTRPSRTGSYCFCFSSVTWVGVCSVEGCASKNRYFSRVVVVHWWTCHVIITSLTSCCAAVIRRPQRLAYVIIDVFHLFKILKYFYQSFILRIHIVTFIHSTNVKYSSYFTTYICR